MNRRGLSHYEVLEVERQATEVEIRKAFRKRLLELHPDKAVGDEPRESTRRAVIDNANGHPLPREWNSERSRTSEAVSDADLLDEVMQAFEILGDARRREEYDDRLERRDLIEAPKSSLPHVTQSQRPVNQARAVLYWLLSQDPDSALERLALIEDPMGFLHQYLGDDEFIDASFLLAEELARRDDVFHSLGWLQALLSCERKRRRHRPCYGQAIALVKEILIYRIAPDLKGRPALEYLRRAESFGLERHERVDVLKRRAECYLELDMKHQAAQELERALGLDPRLEGVASLRRDLSDYLN